MPASHRNLSLRVFVCLGLALVALAFPSRAQVRGLGPSLPACGPLRQFDTDRDGWVDGGEQRAATAVFRTFADLDDDGQLSESELRRAFNLLLAQPGLNQLALCFDADGDGRLNSHEREVAYGFFKSRVRQYL